MCPRRSGSCTGTISRPHAGKLGLAGRAAFFSAEHLEEIDDLAERHLDIGRVLEFGFEENPSARFAGVVLQRVLAMPAIDADEIDLALGALTGQRLGIDSAAQALESRKVVVQQDPVQVRDVDPQSATLAALAYRGSLPFELGHLDVTTGAIHQNICSFLWDEPSSPCEIIQPDNAPGAE